MIDEITTIEKLLERAQKPALSVSRKNLMRENIMRQIESGKELVTNPYVASVSNYVRRVSEGVKLSTTVRVLIKENIFEAIATKAYRVGFFARNWFVFQRVLSGAVVAGILMGVVNFTAVDMRVAFADTITQINEISGGVTVLRDGKEMVASRKMELYEGDKIVTRDDGFASIVFLDDSVTRLSSTTALSITKLFSDPSDKTSTYVEVKVDEGSVWSRVLNLLGKDSAFVVKAGDAVATTKKAAFNVSVSGDDAALEVYNHVVEIKTPVSESKVVSGEKVITGEQENSAVVKIEQEAKGNDWVKMNLENDKVYLAQVSEKKKEGREQVVGGKYLYPFSSIKSGVQKLLTFDDIAKEKLAFSDVQREFVQYEVKLENGEVSKDEAKAIFDKFVASVNGFKEIIANVRENGDNVYADELKVYLQGELSKYRKDLSAVLPDSPLYVAKQVVSEAEFVAAESEVEAVAVKTEQASQKLAEASDLAEAGSDMAAVKALDEYAKAVTETAQKVDNLPDTNKQVALDVITDVVNEGQQVSSVIKETSDVASEAKVTAAANAASNAVFNVSAVGSEVADVEVGTDAGAGAGCDTCGVLQTVSEYAAPVVNTPDGEKPLDPLLR